MAVHIKRNGAFLCKSDIKPFKSHFKNDPHIKLNEAHRLKKMDHLCSLCVEEYYKALDRSYTIVVVDDDNGIINEIKK